MTAGGIFPDVDPAEVARVSEVLGTRMAAATALAAVALIRDPAISPRGLCAGFVQAHLLGLAAAVTSAHASGVLSEVDAMAIVIAAGDVIGDALSGCFPAETPAETPAAGGSVRQ